MPSAQPVLVNKPAEFDMALLPASPGEPPVLEKGITKMSRNETAMLNYLGDLERCRQRCDARLAAAQVCYTADRQALEAQQLEVYRLSAIAQRALRGLDKRIPKAEHKLTTVPTIIIPPPLKTSPITIGADYSRNITRLGKGGIAPGGGLAGAALQVAARLALLYREYQKLLRSFESAKGQLALYRDKAAQRIAELGRAHQEMVAASEKLDICSHQMRELLPVAQKLQKSDQSLSTFESAQMATLQQVALVTAKLHSGRNV